MVHTKATFGFDGSAAGKPINRVQDCHPALLADLGARWYDGQENSANGPERQAEAPPLARQIQGLDLHTEGTLYTRRSLALKADQGETGAYRDIPDSELYGNVLSPQPCEEADHLRAQFGMVGSAGVKLMNRVQNCHPALRRNSWARCYNSHKGGPKAPPSALTFSQPVQLCRATSCPPSLGLLEPQHRRAPVPAYTCEDQPSTCMRGSDKHFLPHMYSHRTRAALQLTAAWHQQRAQADIRGYSQSLPPERKPVRCFKFHPADAPFLCFPPRPCPVPEGPLHGVPMPSPHARTSSLISEPFNSEIGKFGSGVRAGFRDVKFIRSY